ncbi:MAG: 3-methylornithine--L-lysine ligase PylC [Deltaproteobacteria bacterium]|nr:3-methylornithine--L-lysine ligase PylC [Deltaproteobacteria bacterium]
MRIAVVGGNLQGIEAAYLAKKAGWQVFLIDRKAVVPAAGLCDRFNQINITLQEDLEPALKGVDLVIPALENHEALTCLERWSLNSKVPLLFDPVAFSISSSKVKSDQFFGRIGVPTPQPWPGCDFPVLAKPSRGSGSQKVSVFHNLDTLNAHQSESAEAWVIQEFVPGPSYSIEVVGRPGNYLTLQVTDLQMDANYDCKRVLAPTDLTPSLILEFEKISRSIAETMRLKGLMDVEVILHKNTLKVLEVDARLPSQTPTTVFWSTGINILEMLADFFLTSTNPNKGDMDAPRGVVYEHIKVTPHRLEVAGEHLMSGTDALQIRKNFFGANEAITNYSPDRQQWVATLIISEKTREMAWQRRNSVISDIRQHFKLEVYQDLTPMIDIKE